MVRRGWGIKACIFKDVPFTSSQKIANLHLERMLPKKPVPGEFDPKPETTADQYEQLVQTYVG